MSNSTSLSTNGSAPSPTVHLWPLGIIWIGGSPIGIFGSFMILCAIFKSSELRKNRCSALVGNLAICDIVCCINFVISGSLASMASIRGLNSVAMTGDTCFYMRAPFAVALMTSNLATLTLGFDRVLALCWPVFYKSLTSTYTIAINVFTWSFGLIVAILGWIYKDPKQVVTFCNTPSALKGPAFAFWNNSGIAINVMVIITYALAYIRARRLARMKTQNSEKILRQNRILSSILAFGCVYIFGWMSMTVILFYASTFLVDPVAILYCSAYAGIFAMISAGSNFFVYYVRSEEYRRVFRKMMGLRSGQVESQHISTIAIRLVLPRSGSITLSCDRCFMCGCGGIFEKLVSHTFP